MSCGEPHEAEGSVRNASQWSFGSLDNADRVQFFMGLQGVSVTGQGCRACRVGTVLVVDDDQDAEGNTASAPAARVRTHPVFVCPGF